MTSGGLGPPTHSLEDCCSIQLRYEAIKETLVNSYGDAVPFDDANIGNARYVIDDDGDLKDCKEMIVREDLVIVLEQDHDGDVDVTILDPTAAYINN